MNIKMHKATFRQTILPPAVLLLFFVATTVLYWVPVFMWEIQRGDDNAITGTGLILLGSYLLIMSLIFRKVKLNNYFLIPCGYVSLLMLYIVLSELPSFIRYLLGDFTTGHNVLAIRSIYSYLLLMLFLIVTVLIFLEMYNRLHEKKLFNIYFRKSKIVNKVHLLCLLTIVVLSIVLMGISKNSRFLI